MHTVTPLVRAATTSASTSPIANGRTNFSEDDDDVQKAVHAGRGLRFPQIPHLWDGKRRGFEDILPQRLTSSTSVDIKTSSGVDTLA